MFGNQRVNNVLIIDPIIIANYKKSFGGISGVIDTLFENFDQSKDFELQLYNTRKNPFIRVILIFNLLIQAVLINVLVT